MPFDHGLVTKFTTLGVAVATLGVAVWGFFTDFHIETIMNCINLIIISMVLLPNEFKVEFIREGFALIDNLFGRGLYIIFIGSWVYALHGYFALDNGLSLYAMIVGIIDMIVGGIYMVFYFAVKQTFYKVWRNRLDTKVIYIQYKQGYDQLCGVHCINSLLQGPVFNEVDLATLAQDLDKKERELLGGKQFQKSHNVAEDGNFSIQVLSEALKTLGELVIESVDSRINQNQDLSNENGFICNSAAHWFAIRKIEGVWYNLNSTNKSGPEIISDFYLSAFLLSVKENGYQIFVVRGIYPPTDLKNVYQNERQKVFTVQQIRQVHERRMKKKNYNLNIGGSDEIEMQKAIKASKGQKYESSDEDEPIQEQQKPQFGGQGVQLQGGYNSANYDKFHIDPMDAEYFSIIMMTLEQKFTMQLEEGLCILFNMPDGINKQHTFNYDATIEDLYDYVFYEIRQKPFQFTLILPTEKMELLDVHQLLLDLGIDTMTQIVVKKQ